MSSVKKMLHMFLSLSIPFVLLCGFLMSMIAVAGIAAGNSSISTTTSTPIKHLVIIFQENVSFDHYFATYPHATNGANGSKFI
ncbi:MAG: alkaline phosphatase family protein, partial [Candidatus Nitrosopolaris sp.]